MPYLLTAGRAATSPALGLFLSKITIKKKSSYWNKIKTKRTKKEMKNNASQKIIKE